MKERLYKVYLAADSGSGGGSGTSVRQEYNIARMLESELSHMDLSIAMFELIDNALDETPENESSVVVIHFDERDNRIVFENRNTTGMSPEKLQNFVQWGQEHTDEKKLKEHGQGGKLGILYMLSKDNGSLSITSQGKNEKIAHSMHLENWWKNLAPGREFKVETIESEDKEKYGFTRMTLEGVKKDVIPGKAMLVQLAERIGYTYSFAIHSKKLSVKLRRIGMAGKVAADYNVLPVDVPLERVNIMTDIPVEKGNIKLNIALGMVDVKLRTSEAQARKGYYGVEKVMEPQGDRVRIFFREKLIDELELAKFTAGRSRRIAFYNFAVLVNITHGFVEKTILKTGLSKSSPKTTKIYEAISKTIEPHVTKILRESESVEISTSDKKRVQEANVALNNALLTMYKNDLEKIKGEFNLPTTVAISIEQEKMEKTDKKTPPAGTKIISLPGMYGSRKEAKEGKRAKVTRATNPLPTVEMISMGKNYPNASLRKDDVGNKLLVELNFDSPDVKLALRTRGVLGTAQLVRIAVSAMYHEKWLNAYPNNSADYHEGLESDIASFMGKMEELKVLKT